MSIDFVIRYPFLRLLSEIFSQPGIANLRRAELKRINALPALCFNIHLVAES
jgi:hypothetical protein